MQDREYTSQTATVEQPLDEERQGRRRPRVCGCARTSAEVTQTAAARLKATFGPDRVVVRQGCAPRNCIGYVAWASTTSAKCQTTTAAAVTPSTNMSIASSRLGPLSLRKPFDHQLRRDSELMGDEFPGLVERSGDPPARPISPESSA
jgi:hypothetical protein